MQPGDIAIVSLGSVLIVLLITVLASVVMQACASQTYVLTQRLFPALNEAGYNYWLDWGTLLGARREGGMIPHDYDADIGMHESEFQKLRANWKKDAHFHGMRLCKEGGGLYRIRSGLGWVDVFRYTGDGDMLDMLSMAHEKHSCKCPGRGHRIARAFIFPLRSLRFGSVLAPVPADTDSYLVHLYGDAWHIPRKNDASRIMSLVPRLFSR